MRWREGKDEMTDLASTDFTHYLITVLKSPTDTERVIIPPNTPGTTTVESIKTVPLSFHSVSLEVNSPGSTEFVVHVGIDSRLRSTRSHTASLLVRSGHCLVRERGSIVRVRLARLLFDADFFSEGGNAAVVGMGEGQREYLE